MDVAIVNHYWILLARRKCIFGHFFGIRTVPKSAIERPEAIESVKQVVRCCHCMSLHIVGVYKNIAFIFGTETVLGHCSHVKLETDRLSLASWDTSALYFSSRACIREISSLHSSRSCESDREQQHHKVKTWEAILQYSIPRTCGNDSWVNRSTLGEHDKDLRGRAYR